MDTHLTNVDDNDVNNLHYATTDSWHHLQGQPSYQGGTFTEGFTNAQMEFQFNGTRVMVYGGATPRPSGNQSAIPPSISLSIDGGIPSTVVSNPDLQQTEYTHQFYDSRTLSSGEHTLQINVTYGEEDWPFILDYLQYVPLPSSGTSGLAPTEGGLSTGSSHSRTPVGPIVGSVLGCVLLLGAAALVRFYWYFRHPSGKTKKLGLYIYTSAAKVDLLDNEPKLPPSSRAVTPEPASDLESAYATTELRYHTRSPSLGTDHLLSPPSGRRSFFGIFGSRTESRPSSPLYSPESRPCSPPHNRPGTPPASSVLSYQRSATSSSSFALQSRPGTPSAAVTFQRPITPSTAVYRCETPPLPTIVYRPATPESLALLSTSRAGPSRMSTALQLEKEQALRAHKQPTFYADSGVRFKEGDAVPEEALVASSQMAQAKAERDKERKKREKEKEKHISSGASAISEVPPMYTEE